MLCVPLQALQDVLKGKDHLDSGSEKVVLIKLQKIITAGAQASHQLDMMQHDAARRRPSPPAATGGGPPPLSASLSLDAGSARAAGSSAPTPSFLSASTSSSSASAAAAQGAQQEPPPGGAREQQHLEALVQEQQAQLQVLSAEHQRALHELHALRAQLAPPPLVSPFALPAAPGGILSGPPAAALPASPRGDGSPPKASSPTAAPSKPHHQWGHHQQPVATARPPLASLAIPPDGAAPRGPLPSPSPSAVTPPSATAAGAAKGGVGRDGGVAVPGTPESHTTSPASLHTAGESGSAGAAPALLADAPPDGGDARQAAAAADHGAGSSQQPGEAWRSLHSQVRA